MGRVGCEKCGQPVHGYKVQGRGQGSSGSPPWLESAQLVGLVCPASRPEARRACRGAGAPHRAAPRLPPPQAAARCALLSPPALLAANTRQLFHASTRQQAHTGCLLEQAATHILLGLGAAMEAATRALLAPFRPQQLLDAEAAAAAAAAPVAGSGGGSSAAAGGQQQQRQQEAGGPASAGAAAGAAPSDGGPGSGRASRQGSLSRAALQRAAALSVAASVGCVLQAVSTIGAMVRAVQQHYQRVLAPHLAGSGAEARACGAGLAALVRAVDERVAAALQRCLGLLRSQADMTLVAEQQRADFCPRWGPGWAAAAVQPWYCQRGGVGGGASMPPLFSGCCPAPWLAVRALSPPALPQRGGAAPQPGGAHPCRCRRVRAAGSGGGRSGAAPAWAQPGGLPD